MSKFVAARVETEHMASVLTRGLSDFWGCQFQYEVLYPSQVEVFSTEMVTGGNLQEMRAYLSGYKLMMGRSDYRVAIIMEWEE